jgi:hypothetical protein
MHWLLFKDFQEEIDIIRNTIPGDSHFRPKYVVKDILSDFK